MYIWEITVIINHHTIIRGLDGSPPCVSPESTARRSPPDGTSSCVHSSSLQAEDAMPSYTVSLSESEDSCAPIKLRIYHPNGNLSIAVPQGAIRRCLWPCLIRWNPRLLDPSPGGRGNILLTHSLKVSRKHINRNRLGM